MTKNIVDLYQEFDSISKEQIEREEELCIVIVEYINNFISFINRKVYECGSSDFTYKEYDGCGVYSFHPTLLSGVHVTEESILFYADGSIEVRPSAWYNNPTAIDSILFSNINEIYELPNRIDEWFVKFENHLGENVVRQFEEENERLLEELSNAEAKVKQLRAELTNRRVNV